MAFKYVIFAAVLAYANAGYLGAPAVATYAAAPAYASYAAPAVAAAPVAIHAPAVGASHQSVVRGLGGAQAVSTYSKAVDSAFSSVRKYDTRITNDALSVAHAPVAVAHAAPVAAYAAPAPVAAYAAHAAPVAAYAAHAPVVAAAPAAVAYSPAAVVSHVSFAGLGVNYGW